MPYFPPPVFCAPLKTALIQLLLPPQAGPVWFEGPAGIERFLVLNGYTLVHAGVPVRQIVWINQLPRRPDLARERLGMARQALQGNGQALVVEPSVFSGHRGLFTRLGIRFGWFYAPETLSRFFLEAGLVPVKQCWPQGLRSWVITFARET